MKARQPRCPLCRRAVLIVPAENRRGDLILDAAPAADGPVVIETAVNAPAAKRGRFLRRDERSTGDRYQLHRTSCPKACHRRPSEPEPADFAIEDGWLPFREA